jgi:hypothetical protein
MNSKIIKKLVNEIIDSNEDLIGTEDVPEVDNNSDSAAKGTTDMNVYKGHQNYRNNYASLLGFSVLEQENNDEEVIEEDKISDKKDDDKSINKENLNNDILDKKIGNIADILNKKFNKIQLNKLVNLLEIK